MENYIEFVSVKKSFDGHEVLRGVDLSIGRGQLVTLLGPSGCGKSTLLRCLAGLEEVSGGRIRLDGADITDLSPQARAIGMVFQQYSLFPNLSVFENVAFGLRIQRTNRQELQRRVDHMLEVVDLREKAGARPQELSGGQQQRVALARALVLEPKVLLLDEPLSAIDAQLRRSLQTQIRSIQRNLGITTIFVTHDQDEAMILSDVIHLFNQGRLEQSGSPISLYTQPGTHFAASFMGNYNILSAGDFARITGREYAASPSVAIRPETLQISLRPQENPDSYHLRGTVRSFTPHGNVLRYIIEINGVPLHVDVLFRSFHLYEPGAAVHLTVEHRNCLPL
ncbi:MAG: ABC transporter ATP-binding protein [Peptococcaceae bacterium]|nr:ABC transporter ATP-binding protein [Peptococcaceae bacterium]